jgi:hypothetical protein
MTELVLQIAEKRVDFDPLYPYAQRVCQVQMTPEDFMREVVDILYRVGAVGLKPSPQDRYYYSHRDQPIRLLHERPVALHAVAIRCEIG